MKQHLNIHTNRSFEIACASPTLRARRVARVANWSVLIFWLPFVSRQKVILKIKNFLKQHLNTNKNLNLEANIILRSNSWKTNEAFAMRRRVGFNSGASFLTAERHFACAEVNAEDTEKN